MQKFFPIFAIFSAILSGCYDDTIQVEPPVSPALQEGRYVIQVASVDDIQCYGMKARDLVGQSFEASLKSNGNRASVMVEGLRLKGEMQGGILAVEGSMDTPVVMGVEDCPVAEEDTNVSGTSNGSSGSSSGSRGGGSSPPSSPDCGGSSSPSMEIGMELDIRSEVIADGMLQFQMEDGSEVCSFQVEVSMTFDGKQRKSRPVPVDDGTTAIDQVQ